MVVEEDKKIPKKIGIIIGSILFAICLIGITYAAYLTGQTFNDVNLATMVTPNLSYTEDKTMMIQGILPTPKEIAIKAASTNGCYDKSETPIPVCSLYEFTVENTSLDNLTQKVRFFLNVETNTFENYYYMVYDGEKETITEEKAPIIDSSHLPYNKLGEIQLYSLNTELKAGQTQTYTILFYVKETGTNQLYSDTNKKFTASVRAEPIITGSYGGSDANPPDISNTGLTPIVYDENLQKWVVISENNLNWYNYDAQKWANAASLKSTVSTTPGTELDIENDAYAMFVWIPRYSYTIGCTDTSSCLGYKVETDTTELSSTTPGAIDIKFVSSTTKEIYQNSETSGTAPTYTYLTTDTEDQRIAKREEASNWYTHPAFTFGDKELSGIWVGKFETTGGSTSPTILPNKTSLTSQTVSAQFDTAKLFTATDNSYGLTGDAHMMKNSEWGAVVYLTQSIYGKYGNPNYEGANKEIYINNSSSYYTGRSYGAANTSNVKTSAGTYKYDGESTSSSGTKNVLAGTGASTTGNIYGIYDMSGGAWEYVMGNYNNTTLSSGFASTWFTEETNKKYFDKYTTTTPFTTKDKTTNGGALAETASWYGDYTIEFSTSKAWLYRGASSGFASDAGPFAGYTGDGGDHSIYSFRVSFASTS